MLGLQRGRPSAFALDPKNVVARGEAERQQAAHLRRLQEVRSVVKGGAKPPRPNRAESASRLHSENNSRQGTPHSSPGDARRAHPIESAKPAAGDPYREPLFLKKRARSASPRTSLERLPGEVAQGPALRPPQRPLGCTPQSNLERISATPPPAKRPLPPVLPKQRAVSQEPPRRRGRAVSDSPAAAHGRKGSPARGEAAKESPVRPSPGPKKKSGPVPQKDWGIEHLRPKGWDMRPSASALEEAAKAQVPVAESPKSQLPREQQAVVVAAPVAAVEPAAAGSVQAAPLASAADVAAAPVKEENPAAGAELNSAAAVQDWLAQANQRLAAAFAPIEAEPQAECAAGKDHTNASSSTATGTPKSKAGDVSRVSASGSGSQSQSEPGLGPSQSQSNLGPLEQDCRLRAMLTAERPSAGADTAASEAVAANPVCPVSARLNTKEIRKWDFLSVLKGHLQAWDLGVRTASAQTLWALYKDVEANSPDAPDAANTISDIRDRICSIEKELVDEEKPDASQPAAVGIASHDPPAPQADSEEFLAPALDLAGTQASFQNSLMAGEVSIGSLYEEAEDDAVAQGDASAAAMGSRSRPMSRSVAAESYADDAIAETQEQSAFADDRRDRHGEDASLDASLRSTASNSRASHKDDAVAESHGCVGANASVASLRSGPVIIAREDADEGVVEEDDAVAESHGCVGASASVASLRSGPVISTREDADEDVVEDVPDASGSSSNHSAGSGQASPAASLQSASGVPGRVGDMPAAKNKSEMGATKTSQMYDDDEFEEEDVYEDDCEDEDEDEDEEVESSEGE